MKSKKVTKVKGAFAPIRVGLIEHMWRITPMECKVYLTQHLMAVRKGKDRGNVFTSTRQLAKITGHKWDHIKRSLVGLEKKDYIKPFDGGWQILNFNGDNPANTLSRNGVYPETGYTPEKDKTYPEKGEHPIPKRDTPLSRKGITSSRKPKKRKVDREPLNDKKTYKKDDQEVSESVKTDSSPDWPGWYSEIRWDRKAREVAFSEKGRSALSSHLQSLAKEESLPLLSKRDKQLAWGRLNGWLMRNRQCTGPKSLPPIVVNWFENDLRNPTRIRGPTSKRRATDDAFDEAIRKAEEEERE